MKFCLSIEICKLSDTVEIVHISRDTLDVTMVYFTQTSCPLCYNEQTLCQTDIMQTLHIRQYSVCLVLPKSNLMILIIICFCQNLSSSTPKLTYQENWVQMRVWRMPCVTCVGGGGVAVMLHWCSRYTDWTASRQRQLTTSVRAGTTGAGRK